MNFQKYQHIERLGTDATDGILNGTVYIFPKLDGANASVYLNDNGEVEVASRNRPLTGDSKDLRELKDYVRSNPNFKAYFDKYPKHRLFGEWLVPHSIKNYLPDAWHKLYIFDVMIGNEYIPYADYSKSVIEFDLPYIHPFACLFNPSLEGLQSFVDQNDYLMQEGHIGEGIVIKNYDFVNKFGNIVWAKIVRPKHRHEEKIQRIATATVESLIVDKFLSPEFVVKEYSKLAVDGWNSKLIPRLLGTIWHAFITEEIFNVIRKFHNPTIDFATLNKLVVARTKELLPDVFGG